MLGYGVSIGDSISEIEEEQRKKKPLPPINEVADLLLAADGHAVPSAPGNPGSGTSSPLPPISEAADKILAQSPKASPSQGVAQPPVPKVPGLRVPGNIDLKKRPVVHNPDNSISTVKSISVGFDDGTYLLPTITPDGRVLSNTEEAIQLFLDTGMHLGIYDSPEAADAAAKTISQGQGEFYGGQQKSLPPISEAADMLLAGTAPAPAPAPVPAIDRSEHGNNMALNLNVPEAAKDPLHIGAAVQNAYWNLQESKGNTEAMRAFQLEQAKRENTPGEVVAVNRSGVAPMTPVEEAVMLRQMAAKDRGDMEQAAGLEKSFDYRVDELKDEAKRLWESAEKGRVKYDLPDNKFGAAILQTIESSGMTVEAALRSGALWALGGPALGLMGSLVNTAVESDYEGGEAFMTALRAGKSPEEVQAAVDFVRRRNFGTLLTTNPLGDVFLFGLGKPLKALAGKIAGKGLLAKAGRSVVERGVPYVLGAAPEGVEGGSQEAFQQQAAGQDLDWEKIKEAAGSEALASLLYGLVGRGIRGGAKVLLGGQADSDGGKPGEPPAPPPGSGETSQTDGKPLSPQERVRSKLLELREKIFSSYLGPGPHINGAPPELNWDRMSSVMKKQVLRLRKAMELWDAGKYDEAERLASLLKDEMMPEKDTPLWAPVEETDEPGAKTEGEPAQGETAEPSMPISEAADQVLAAPPETQTESAEEEKKAGTIRIGNREISIVDTDDSDENGPTGGAGGGGIVLPGERRGRNTSMPGTDTSGTAADTSTPRERVKGTIREQLEAIAAQGGEQAKMLGSEEIDAYSTLFAAMAEQAGKRQGISAGEWLQSQNLTIVNGRPEFEMKDNSLELKQNAGVNSKTAPRHALGRAKQMERAGKRSARDIYAETGWFRGPDGEWRYVIDDSKASIAPDFKNAVSKLKLKAVSKQDVTLGELLDHPDLYAAYPHLKNVKIKVDFGRAGGAYLEGNYPLSLELGTQSLTNDTKPATDDELVETLLHEIQHSIQAAEGFTRGGNLQMVQARMQALWDRKDDPDLTEEEREAARNELKKFGYDPSQKEFKPNRQTLYDAYRRIGGEAEARLTSWYRNARDKDTRLPNDAMAAMLKSEWLMRHSQDLNDILLKPKRGSLWDFGVPWSVSERDMGFGSDEIVQAISSANTSLNQIAATFRHPKFSPVDKNLDIGGGKFNKGTEFLASRGIENVIFDPYNRPSTENKAVIKRLKSGERFPTVTSNNVLNVIAEQSVRENVILQSAKALSPDGTAYFLIHEGDSSGVGKETTRGWQNNKKTNEYMNEIKKHFNNVTKSGNLLIARNPVNTNGLAAWDSSPDVADRVFFQKTDEAEESAQQGPAAEKITIRGTTVFGKGSITITLGKAMDRTTLVHEFGHLFLADLLNQARKGVQSAVRDATVLMNWWLKEATWLAKWISTNKYGTYTAEQAARFAGKDGAQLVRDALAGKADPDTAQIVFIAGHEMFARGFERYLSDGTAPNSQLKAVFERFKTWMAEVYGKLAGDPNFKLSQDAREVMDRMVGGETTAAAQAGTAENVSVTRNGNETVVTLNESPVEQETSGEAGPQRKLVGYEKKPTGDRYYIQDTDGSVTPHSKRFAAIQLGLTEREFEREFSRFMADEKNREEMPGEETTTERGESPAVVRSNRTQEKKPKLVGYEWKSGPGERVSTWDGGVIPTRVSDWDRSEISAGSGREIVHVFYIRDTDGTVKPYGRITALRKLGYSDQGLNREANRLVSEHIAREEEVKRYTDTINKYTTAKTAGEANVIYLRDRGNKTLLHTYVFEKDGKYITFAPTDNLIEAMNREGGFSVKLQNMKDNSKTQSFDFSKLNGEEESSGQEFFQKGKKKRPEEGSIPSGQEPALQTQIRPASGQALFKKDTLDSAPSQKEYTGGSALDLKTAVEQGHISQNEADFMEAMISAFPQSFQERFEVQVSPDAHPGGTSAYSIHKMGGTLEDAKHMVTLFKGGNVIDAIHGFGRFIHDRALSGSDVSIVKSTWKQADTKEDRAEWFADQFTSWWIDGQTQNRGMAGVFRKMMKALKGLVDKFRGKNVLHPDMEALLNDIVTNGREISEKYFFSDADFVRKYLLGVDPDPNDWLGEGFSDNSKTFTSWDPGNLCPKKDSFIEYIVARMKKEGKTYADLVNVDLIAQWYDDALKEGIQVPCSYCYVEQARRKAIQFQQQGKSITGVRFAMAKTSIRAIPYNGALLNERRFSDKKINEMNKRGGLRMFSFSDYIRAVHRVQIGKMLRDAAKRMLSVKAITKVAEFVEDFASTGITINQSLDAMNPMFGMDWDLAVQNKEKYPNVKIRVVARNLEEFDRFWKLKYRVKPDGSIEYLDAWKTRKQDRTDQSGLPTKPAKDYEKRLAEDGWKEMVDVITPYHHDDYTSPVPKGYEDLVWDGKSMRELRAKNPEIVKRTCCQEGGKCYNAKTGEQCQCNCGLGAGNLSIPFAVPEALNEMELNQSSLDADYLAAVEAGDTAAAQRMVDEAAKEAGYGIGPLYHGTNTEFNTFDKDKVGTNYSKKTPDHIGFFFTNRKEGDHPGGTAKDWARQSVEKKGGTPVVVGAYLKIDNPFTISDYAASIGDDIETIMTYAGDRQPVVDIFDNDSQYILKKAKEMGRDGIAFVDDFEGDSDGLYVAFEPEQIKSADPVVMDDHGNVIPLSKRFDASSPSILYQRTGDEKPPTNKKKQQQALTHKAEDTEQARKLTNAPENPWPDEGTPISEQDIEEVFGTRSRGSKAAEAPWPGEGDTVTEADIDEMFSEGSWSPEEFSSAVQAIDDFFTPETKKRGGGKGPNDPKNRERYDKEGNQLSENPKDESYLNPVYTLTSPSLLAKKNKQFAPFFKMAKEAQELQETLRRDFNAVLDKAWGNLSDDQSQALNEILIEGDLRGRTFTDEQLTARGLDEDVRRGYSLIRDLSDRVGKAVRQRQRDSGTKVMGWREGYVPHIFHGFFIRLEGRIVDTARSLQEAVELARNVEKDHPGGTVDIVSKPNDFSGSSAYNASALNDRKLLKFSTTMEEAFAFTPDEAERFLKGYDKKAFKNRIFAFSHERLGVKGWDQDMKFAFRHYVNQSARFLAMDELKYRGLGLFEKTWGNFNHEYKGIAKYTKDYLNDVLGVPSNASTQMNEWFKRIPGMYKISKQVFGDRPAEYLASVFTKGMGVAKLGFLNIASAMMNLSQMINASALLGYNDLRRGIQEYFANLKNPSERVTRIYEETGVSENLNVAAGAGYSKASERMYGAIGRFLELSMAPFAYMDGMCRKATVLAAYNKAHREGKSHTEAIAYAKEINDRANFDYSVADTPAFLRRSGPLGQVIFQFKKFGIKQLELATGLNGFAQNARFWIPMIALSGLWGFPGAELLRALFMALFDRDPQAELNAWMAKEDWISEPVRRTIQYGALSNAGVDISKRVGMGDVIPNEVADLLGPTVGTIHRMAPHVATLAGKLFGLEGDGTAALLNALEALSPGLSNPIKAILGEVEDKKRGRLKFRYQGSGERAVRAMGFRPTREAVESDAVRTANYVEAKRMEREREAIDEYVRARESGSTKDAAKALARLKELKVTPDRIIRELRERKKGTAYERLQQKLKGQKSQEARKVLQGF